MPARFSLCTWNILADSYIRPHYYLHIPPAFLDPKSRVPSLMQRAASLQHDILCFQEVETAIYSQLRTALAPLGYASLFALKGAGKPDGCATFYRPAHCALLREETLHYQDAEPKSGHIAHLMAFRIGDAEVALANTHLKWDAPETPPHDTWTLRQTKLAVRALTALAADAHLICGDFNAPPSSAAAQFLHSEGFQFTHQEPESFTANFNRRPELIDFIFYRGVEAQPQPLSRITAATPLPSPEEPSDHLPVAAIFSTLP